MSKQSISILAVDDEESFLDLLKSLLEQEGYYVNTAPDGVAAINVLQTLPFDLVLLDVKMPRVDGVEVLRFIKDHYLDTQVIMLTGVSDIRIAVECMQLGAYHYVTKPYAGTELLTIIERAIERKRLVIQNKALKSELARFALSSHIVGQSKSFLEVLNLASRVAPTDSTVLVQGASGTGKELIASFLHNNSLRKEQPFMALNCASIPESLIESEVFGHEKGAFTDAIATKQGLVEIANGGTLFLDEIGEISLMIQPKLLRFLQTGEYRRVGGNKNMKADVRIISATNKDLRQEVGSGRFREDLLYRINVITLQIPSLRERRDDIPTLVDYFLRKRFVGREPKQIDPRALEILMKYDWPGNVRELENVIERAAILSQENIIRVDDLALPIGTRSIFDSYAPAADGDGPRLGAAVPMVEIEKSHINGVLKTVSWNKNMAAKILGISLKTLYTKIQQYNLSKE
ncbi:MAG TPA: sigma-54-dependent Fis family transcriptional regulator [Bacteroidetes bacterium]|nr:sigma-54-dependent Fis family transcriptional regulator [Bacteroidota bacterium]